MSFLVSMLRKVPGSGRINGMLRAHYLKDVAREVFPRGHFYSPLPDLAEVKRQADQLFRRDVDVSASIDLAEQDQISLLQRFAVFYSEFGWMEPTAEGSRFHFNQGYFGEADAISLYSMLRYAAPKRVIEVGSGFSSALMLDTDEKFLGQSIRFTFIEPYPERLLSVLTDEDHQRCRIIKDKVQLVKLAEFEALEDGDILFIDSSHVSKIGSDVNYLIFEVLPVLRPGVIVHFHDIFWPFEYPKEWVMGGRAWNEDYLLRAFLQYNNDFKIMLFNNFAGYRFSDYLQEHMPRFMANTGGSLWLRKHAGNS